MLYVGTEASTGSNNMGTNTDNNIAQLAYNSRIEFTGHAAILRIIFYNSEMHSKMHSEMHNDMHSEMLSKLLYTLYERERDMHSEMHSGMHSEMHSDMHSEMLSKLLYQLYNTIHFMQFYKQVRLGKDSDGKVR